MRGIVTLAAALALPDGNGPAPEFPFRDLLVTGAFAVVLGTLVIQGLTLAPLMRWLRLADDGAVARELAEARQIVTRAAVDALEDTDSPYAPSLIEELEQAGDRPDRHTLTLHLISLQRTRLVELRRSSVIGDAAFQQLEEELDWAEGHTLRRLRSSAAEA
jgi:CPA1 family monovalent cation:H+ antiporter